MSCLAETTVLEFVAGRLSPQEVASVDDHIDSCETCRMLLRAVAQNSMFELQTRAGEADLALSPTVAERGAAPAIGLDRGTHVGRYVILDLLGRGGMGVVYAAFDPELDRKIALKLLHPELGGGEAGAMRLLREGRAIAKLAHPNVVAVFDVGTHDGAVFVAMELVAGRSLDAWLAEQPRPWREVVDVFVQAGAGLVAAHAAGMVHRDFKPANVLLGKDGRARVTDFGLARVDGSEQERSAHEKLETLTDERLTRTGTLVGTPAYMAPEQFEAHEVGPVTDQFSFAVSLYEALYRERPYAGRTVAEIFASIVAEEVRPAPAGSTVPAWLRAVVLRGLRAKPHDRHASMEDMLDGLRPKRSRRRWVLAGAAAVVVVALAGAGVAWLARDGGPSRLATCNADAQRIDEVWGPAMREKVRGAFAAIGTAPAQQTWQRVHDELDAYSSRWAAAWHEACRAGEHSPQLGALGVSCLDERRRELDALVTTLATTDAKVVAKAVAATASLPSVATCADARYLLATIKPSEVQTPETLAITKDLAGVRAQIELGRFEPGRRAARSAVAAADKLGHRALQANARLQLGRVEAAMAETEAARVDLETAVEHSLASGHDELAFAGWRQLAQHFGYVKGDLEAADRWLGLAAAAVERLGSPAQLRADLEFTRGSVDLKRPRYADARRRFLAALEPYARDPSLELSRIRTLSNLAIAEWELQEYAAARDHQGTACELMERKLGPLHPTTSTCFMNFGVDLRTAGDLEAADTMFTRAIVQQEKSLPATHPALGIAFLNRGKLRTQRRQLVEARGDLDRALAILEAAKSPEVTDALTSIGVAAAAAGKRDEARDFYMRVVTLLRAKPGTETKLAVALNNLGNSELVDGRLAAARAALREAQALFAKHAGPAHPFTVQNLQSLATLELTDDHASRAVALLQRALSALQSRESSDAERGHILANLGFAHARARSFDDARVVADQALRLLGAGLDDAEARGYARFALAMALRGSNRAKADEVANQARADFEALGPNGKRSLDLLDAWRAK